VSNTSQHYRGALGGEGCNEWKSSTSARKSEVQHAVLWSLYASFGIDVNTSYCSSLKEVSLSKFHPMTLQPMMGSCTRTFLNFDEDC